MIKARAEAVQLQSNSSVEYLIIILMIKIKTSIY